MYQSWQSPGQKGVDPKPTVQSVFFTAPPVRVAVTNDSGQEPSQMVSMTMGSTLGVSHVNGHGMARW